MIPFKHFIFLIMKRIVLFMTLATLLFTGCQKTKEFKTHTVSDERCWLQIFGEPFVFDSDTIGVKLSYSLVWPDNGMMSAEAERELQYLSFGDSNSADMNAAANKWLSTPFCYMEENPVVQQVDSLPDGFPSSYLEIESSCTLDGNLAVFAISTDGTPYGAAHGFHSVDYLTVDIETGKAIHLTDLVTDTNLLCEAIARAIQDLEVNSDVYESLFEEFIDTNRMPLPSNFIIDSARNSITVFYGLYEIAAYCYGIQEVVLPIFWLSKHVPLTPFCKQLFGPGCSVE